MRAVISLKKMGVDPESLGMPNTSAFIAPDK